MLIAWNGAIAISTIVATVLTQGQAVFVGQTWKWRAPLVPIAITAALMTALAFIAMSHAKGEDEGEPASDYRFPWRRVGLLLFLTPAIAWLFYSGDGFDWTGKLATALSVVQWIGLIVSIESGRSK